MSFLNTVKENTDAGFLHGKILATRFILIPANWNPVIQSHVAAIHRLICSKIKAVLCDIWNILLENVTRFSNFTSKFHDRPESVN